MRTHFLICAIFSIFLQPLHAEEVVVCKAGPSAKCGQHTLMVTCNGIEGYVDSIIKRDAKGNVVIRPGVDKIYGPCGVQDVQEELETCKWVSRAPDGYFTEFAEIKDQVQAALFISIEMQKSDCKLPGGTNYMSYSGPSNICAGMVRCIYRDKVKMVSCPSTGDYSCPSPAACDQNNMSTPYTGDWKSLGLSSAPAVAGKDPANSLCIAEFQSGGKGFRAAGRMVAGKCPKVQQLNDDSCAHARNAKQRGEYTTPPAKDDAPGATITK